ncbi:MAG: hypothetical protein O3C15_00170 [Proteobacteria bacterium]|nr:hypothetical protein [Pseudomonadota bacterium]
MARVLHLHIGVHKTGTTSLQEFLFGNRDILEQRGFHYPTNAAYFWRGELSHSFLAHSLRAERPHYLPAMATYDADTAYQQLAADVANKKNYQIILSSEHFSLLYSKDDVARVAERLLEICPTTKIYVYLRRQDEAIEANYKQGIRTKAFWVDFPTYVSNALASNYDRWNYQLLVDNYRQAFGKDSVFVRLYEPDKLLNANIIDDFLRVLGLENRPPFRQISRQNQSWPVEALEFLRHISPYLTKPKFIAFKQAIQRNPAVFNQGQFRYLDSHLSQTILAAYEAPNTTLATTLNCGQPAALFDPTFKEIDTLINLSSDRLSRLMGGVFEGLID